MEPIACECGKPIGNLYDAFYLMRRTHDDHHIMKSLRIDDLCCRKSFIGCVDFYKLRNGDYETSKRISDLPRDMKTLTIGDEKPPGKDDGKRISDLSKDMQAIDSDEDSDEKPPVTKPQSRAKMARK